MTADTQSKENHYRGVFLTEKEARDAIAEAKKRKYEAMGQGVATRKQAVESAFWSRVLTLESEFEINDDNARVVDILIRYFAGDISLQEEGISLAKGLMLAGPVGCGKTLLMRAFSSLKWGPYAVIPAREIVMRWKSYDNKDEFYGEYSRPLRGGFQLCLDDLGNEDLATEYGIMTSVTAELIQMRYVRREKTYFTTNLSGSELESMYGSRIKSRLHEMVNYIAFPANAKDRRI